MQHDADASGSELNILDKNDALQPHQSLDSASSAMKQSNPLVDDSLTQSDFDTWWMERSDGEEFCDGDIEGACTFAAGSGRLDVICYLQRTYGIDWSSEEAPLDGVIWKAVSSGSLPILRYLHTIHGVDFNDHREMILGDDIMETAVRYGYLDILKWLIDEVGLELLLSVQKLLESSAEKGYLSFVEYAAAIGGDVNAVDDNTGANLVHLTAAASKDCESLAKRVRASKMGDPEPSEDDIDENGEENAEEDVNDEKEKSARQVAPKQVRNHLKVLQWLQEQQLDVNARRKDGATALHLAAESGHLEIVKWLLTQGADLSAKTVDGRSVAHFAARSFDLAVLKWLEATHQWDFAVDKSLDGSTLAHAATEVRRLGLLAALKFLHAKGVDMKAKRQVASSPTVLAIASSYADFSPDLIKWLRSDCAVDVGALCTTNQSVAGSTPSPLLFKAIEYGQLGFVKWLHADGADLDAKMNGYSAAAVAAKYAQLDILKWLHSLGYDVIGINNNQMDVSTSKAPAEQCLPPPFLAAESRANYIVEWYVDTLGVDVKAVDARTGASFASVAASSGNASLLDWLSARGVNTEKQ